MLGLGLTAYIPEFIYFLSFIVMAISIFYKPQAALYLMTFLIPLQNLRDRLVPFASGKNIMDFLLISLILGALLHRSSADRSKIISKKDRNLVITIIVLIIGSYSSLWIGHFKLGLPMPISIESEQLIQWKNFVMLPILFFAAKSVIKNKKQVYIMLGIMIFTVFLMDMYFYDNARWMDFSHYSEGARNASGSTLNTYGPNEVASFLAEFGIFLIAFYSVRKWDIYKVIFAVVIAYTFYAVLFYYSRGAYMATAAGLLFIGLTRNRLILVIILALVIGWSVILPQSVVERIEMTEGSGGGLDRSSQSRIDMWKKGLSSVKTNPVTGIGFGSTKFLGIANKSGTGFATRHSLHNGYLQVLVEEGVVGLAILLFIMYSSAKSGWRLFKNAEDKWLKGLGLGMTALVITSLVNNITGSKWLYFDIMGFFWLLFAITAKSEVLIAMEQTVQDNEPEKSKQLSALKKNF